MFFNPDIRMSKKDREKLMSDLTGCLNCGKKISYEILKSRFCVDCNRKYTIQIRKKREEMKEFFKGISKFIEKPNNNEKK